MATGVDFLFFVEDAGVSHFVAALPQRLAAAGLTSVLSAQSHAATEFESRNVNYLQIRPGTSAHDLFDKFHPRVIVAGTSMNQDSLSLSLFDRARAQGVCSVGIVDRHVNAQRRFCGRNQAPLAHAPEWLLVPDDATRRAFEQLGFAAGNILVCGDPRFDEVRLKGNGLARLDRQALRRSLLPHAPEKKPVVLFVSECANPLNPEDFMLSSEYTLAGQGSRKRSFVVLEELVEALSVCGVEPHLVARVHPADSQEDLERYLQAVDFVSTNEDRLDLLWVSDLVVGMTSFLLAEAALLGRPTVSLVPRIQEREWLTVPEWCTIPCITDRRTLQALLADWANGLWPDAQATGSFAQAGKSGGQPATERIASALARLLASNTGCAPAMQM